MSEGNGSLPTKPQEWRGEEFSGKGWNYALLDAEIRTVWRKKLVKNAE
jgi:hypothetical protein